MRKFNLEIIAEDDLAVEYAVEHALKQVREGYTSGDLRNESVDSGYWELHDVCPECMGEGKIKVSNARQENGEIRDEEYQDCICQKGKSN